MKKTNKYESGGSIDEGVRARAMKSVEGLEGIKGSDVEDETGTAKGSIKRNEYGDLYDSEMKSSVSKKTTAKPTPKDEPKAETKEKTNPVQQLKNVIKGKDISAPKSFTEAGGNTKAKTQKVDTSGFSFGSVAKKLREKAGITSYKSGGKVKSASARADGCAIRGKTRA